MRSRSCNPWAGASLAALFITVVAPAAVAPARAAGTDARQQAQAILEKTAVRGGLVVHVGCGDGKLTAALRASDSYLVHGLDTDAGAVAKARAYLRERGACGPVSADRFDGRRLPYVDNLVNLLVADDLGEVPREEVRRVLAPGGVLALLNEGGEMDLRPNPRPAAIDDWTHYLHDATNNAVSRDTRVGPARHLQWVGSPVWTRHHDSISSFTACVSAGGRIFYIIDEGPRSHIQLPARWTLVARDAFSGTVLWKRPMANWPSHLWLLKSGPAGLPRRLVAAQDTVYVAMGLDQPVSALDAATGETIRTFPETKAAEEILYSRGTLLVLVNPHADRHPWSTREAYETAGQIRAEPERWKWDAPDRRLVAIDAASGGVRWQRKTPVVPLTLTADANSVLREDTDSVLYHDGERIVCLSRTGGEVRWRSEPIPRADPLRCWFGPTLVLHGDTVLFAGGERIERHRGGEDTMTALDAASGKRLWSAPHPRSGYDSPEDLFVIDGQVWTAPMTNRRHSGTFTARNLRTGEVERTFKADDGDHMSHHRCHRAKATVRYILASRTGIEYVDLDAGHWDRNDWVRGACLYGIVPANGFTYAPPHSCACYVQAKLNGFNALAAASPTREVPEDVPAEERLERGTDSDKPIRNPQSEIRNGDWPTYRHDPARTGRTAAAVPADLAPAWKADVGGRLSALTLADGRLYVAAVDAHTVHTLDASSGEPVWSFTAGGRVDSPPTIWRGRVLFGSADGCIYAVRAADGALLWRFRAAPLDRRLTAWEQVESVWPVHGSVLVLEEGRGEAARGIVYAVAGRSMFVDGGLRLVRLEAATGRLLSETVMDDRHPETGRPLDADIVWPDLPTALPDILSYDGTYIYMRDQKIGRDGRRLGVAPPGDFKQQAGEGAHLFSPTGFLDDSWWHRTYWLWGKNPGSAAGRWYAAAYHAPAGRIMVAGRDRVFAFGRTARHFPQTTSLEYHLFAAKKAPEIIQTGKRRKNWLPDPHRPVYDWSESVPLLGRALVLAGDRLVVAGPPDVVDTYETLQRWGEAEAQQALADQAAALGGGKGGRLRVVSAADGTMQAEVALDAPPVFDGM
ncbi:MAG: PQQ-binding-like beta-propeller repeat protein, partial [Phycisphaerae bacterium]